MTILDVVVWLRDVERLASSVYRAAADASTNNSRQAEFLRNLAADESSHYHIMGSATNVLRQQKSLPISAIIVDDGVKSQTEAPLHDLQEKLRTHRAGDKDILTALVRSETSEWNSIFTYAIAACARFSPEFEYVAASVQAHERRIEEYVAGASSAADLRDLLAALPRIWSNRLLIVDDDAALRELYRHVMSRYGEVVLAEDGEAALRAIRKQFFNVIITDVDMPLVDGVSFIKTAVQETPRLAAHFLVCTGRPTDAVVRVTAQYGIRLVEKPMAIESLRGTVVDILRNAL